MSDELNAEVDESPDSEPTEEPEFPPEAEPVPVELTDAIYTSFKESFGESQAQLLQNSWSDAALNNQKVVGAVLQDNPNIDQIYSEHQSEDGGLTFDGAILAGEHLAKQSGFDNLATMVAQHQEIDHLFRDHFNESAGTLSPVGVYQLLNYFGKQAGYSFTHTG